MQRTTGRASQPPSVVRSVLMGIESDFPALDVRGGEIGVVVMRMEEGRRTAKDRTEVLQAKVLGNGENLLPMLVWTEDLGTLADDKHAKIGIK